MKQKYNVLMACGNGYFGVTYKPTEDDLQHPFKVWCNDGETRMAKTEDGGYVDCLGCKCRRKAKRKQDMFFTNEDKEDHRRPTGIVVTCHVDKIEEVAQK